MSRQKWPAPALDLGRLYRVCTGSSLRFFIRLFYILTELYPVFAKFDQVSLDSNWFYLVLLGFTGFHLVLLGFVGFYWVLPGFTGFYQVFTGFYQVLLGFTGFYWVLLGFTGSYWVLLGFTGFSKVGPRFPSREKQPVRPGQAKYLSR